MVGLIGVGLTMFGLTVFGFIVVNSSLAISSILNFVTMLDLLLFSCKNQTPEKTITVKTTEQIVLCIRVFLAFNLSLWLEIFISQ